jgi:SAM-dependent methyltransferase
LDTKQMSTGSDQSALEDVRAFWDAHPCGAWRVKEPFGTPQFYEAYRAYRYRKQWHIDLLVPFADFKGKRLLEIGCGVGADGVRAAQAGADYTGVDLTQAAVDATRMHFAAAGVQGRFLIQNAENMSDFADASFDVVFSHGVLHHTPNPQAALSEVARVLKPGGQIVLMLYHRHSFNYFVRILGAQRAAALAYVAARSLLPRSKRRGKLDQHYANFKRWKFGYFRARRFAHHCADGVDCPIAYSYTRQEVAAMLSPQFSGLRFVTAHLPIRQTFPFVSKRIEGLLASRMGWYLFIYGQRTSAAPR